MADPQDTETALQAWEPERDWALREYDRDRQRLPIPGNAGNQSAPYQRAAAWETRHFADVAEALRVRARALLPGRAVAEPNSLANFLIGPLETRALAALQNLVESYRARGHQNVAIIQEPVTAHSAKVRDTAASVRAGIAEDARAEQRRAGSAAAVAVQSIPTVQRSVITLHGIKTRGEWQKEITEPLSRAGFSVVPLDYGYFWAWQLRISWYRRWKVEWFKKKYFEKRRANEPPPDLIAHSFGTYIAAEAMRRYPEVQFTSIVLCGSIVERGYPWKAVKERKQCTRVLNEIAGRDKVVQLAEWALADAGASGTDDGFDDATPGLLQNRNPLAGHSDVLYPERAERLWIPFLRGEAITPDPEVPTPLHNQKAFWLTGALVLALLVVLAGWWWSVTRPDVETLLDDLSPSERTKATSAGAPSPLIFLPTDTTPSSSSATVREAPHPAAVPPSRPVPTPPASTAVATATHSSSTMPSAKTIPTDSPHAEKKAQDAPTKEAPGKEPKAEESNSVDASPSSPTAPTADDIMFLETMERFGGTTGAIREAVHWLASVRQTPLDCRAYRTFLKHFDVSTRDSRRHYWRAQSAPADRDDAVLETAHYVSLDDLDCLRALQRQVISAEASRLLVEAHAAMATLSMGDRRRRHAQALVRRMDGRLALIRSASLWTIDSEQFDETNYLVFMADALLSDQPAMVPTPIEVPGFSPRWRETLRETLTPWRNQVATIAGVPCIACDSTAPGHPQRTTQ